MEEKKKLKPAVPDHVAEVIKKYAEAGWTAIRAPKNSTNDVIAQKGPRYHFVQVVTPENSADVKFQDLPKNTFIQNAFSNSATPVYAKISRKSANVKISFEDANTGGRVLIPKAAEPKK